MAERESLSNILAAWSQVASALVGAVAAVVAAIIGLESIEQGKTQDEQAKTQQTLQFFATFNAPNMLSLRDKISNEDWCVRYGYLPRSESYTTTLNPAEIVSVVDFFDAVNNSCGVQDGGGQANAGGAQGEAGMCNLQLTDQLFGSYASEFYDDLSRAILEMRGARNPTFGEGMAALAQETAPVEEVAARYAQQHCDVTPPQ